MYEVYTVLNGDTIDKIANQYGIEKGELVQINGFSLNENLIPGMMIVVPVKRETQYEYYTVKKGDNIYDIALENDIDYNMLLQLNGLEMEDYIYPNQTIILPKKGLKIYLTKDDDTLTDVLNRLNITFDELRKENQKIYLRPDQIIIFKEK